MKKPIAIEKFFDAVFLSCRNKSRESAHEKRKRKVWKDYCRLRWTSVDTTAPDQNLDHGPDKLGSTVRPSMASIDSGVRGLNKENRRRRTSMNSDDSEEYHVYENYGKSIRYAEYITASKKKRRPHMGSNISKPPTLFEIPKILNSTAWVSPKIQKDTKTIKN